MIKAIIFDCFGVLYSDGKDYMRGLCPPSKHQELFDLYHQNDYGFISTEQFFNEVSKLLGMDEAELRQVNLQQYVKNQPLIEFLKELKKSYKIGLLSNIGDSFLDSLFSRQERVELFDEMVLSSLVGAIKPHPEAYQAIADKLGLRSEECIMIDDIEENCDGARRVGMQAVLYEDVSSLRRQLNKLLAV